MTTGPGGEDRPEPTFADVMNAFSLDSGRKQKRRRWGRRGEPEPEQQPTEPAPVADFGVQQGDYPEDRYADLFDRYDAVEDADAVGPAETDSTSVRPYAWTRGRTSTGYALQIETLVTTSPRGREQMVLLQVEHRAVAELCQQARSVAEVAALLKVPLGVAKVLVGDMAGLGLVAVHQSAGANGDIPNLALMERVLSGLRRL
jgi:hypothetical protein